MFKLMIVDDEPNVVSGIKSVIDWAGNNIEICATANDGKEALELIKKVSPDIILSDIKMPNMTGLELIQKLHESGINSNHFSVVINNRYIFACIICNLHDNYHIYELN